MYTDFSKNPEHQVFLSFRGVDTRVFVGHLFYALQKTGFRVFLDNDGIEHGKDIQLELREAINRSEMSVVVLSRGYADSRWCLDELVGIMDREALKVHSVLPVFFDVEPTDVRHQMGVYMKSFKVLEERFQSAMDKVERWRSAMKRVANLKGLCLNTNRDESSLVQSIIRELGKMVKTSIMYVPPNIVGRDLILHEITNWLQDGSPDVEIALIYGLAGIGKSTVAKIAFNYNAQVFDGCSFLADFTRKTKQTDGLARLLEQIFSDVTGKPGNKIHNVDKGMQDVRAILCCRRVLVVLDDVDELKYLPYAFDDPDFFCGGSKIIITTRNEELRKVSLFKTKFKICELNLEESKELLKLQAFIKIDAPLLYHQEELLNEFLQHCQGIPLALHVLGPLLRNETEDMWRNLLNELKAYPDHKLFNVFRLSFECIEDEYTKDLFVYIACFFVGVDKRHALKVLEGCGLRPISGFENLVNRSLVTIDCFDKLVMHLSIEEMGKEIARQESVNEPGRRSKLWSSKDSLYVLQNVKGTSAIRGLRVNLPKPDCYTMSGYQNFENSPKCPPLDFCYMKYLKHSDSAVNLESVKSSSFAMMLNLNLLLLNHVHLDGSFEDFPKKLIWLVWLRCPLQSIPPNFNLEELVVLEMQTSCLVRAWEGYKYMGALRILDFSNSQHLACTPDLSGALLLESLFFEGCINLVEVHESLGNLRNLTHLNMEGCVSLVMMHKSVENLKKLSILNLNGCKSLMSFPVYKLSSLEHLNLSGCFNFSMAPSHMKSSVNSIVSSLPRYGVPFVPPCMSLNFYLPSLTRLSLASCGLCSDNLLDWLQCAPSLEYLDLSDNPIHVLNNNDVCASFRIKKLILQHCFKLQTVSNLPRSCEVSVEFCSSLEKITYVYEPGTMRIINAFGCHELAEIDYGCNDPLIIEWTRNMDGTRAKYLGFPNLNTFDYGSISEFENDDIDFGRGSYHSGTYQVYLLGDHVAKWFEKTESVAEYLYTVPTNELPIRALNIGFVVSAPDRDFVTDAVTVENVTRMWTWTLNLSAGEWLDREIHEITLTWLGHWYVTENRDIENGDLLKISAASGVVKWGVKVLHEEQHVSEDIKKEGSASVAVWYNTLFRSPLNNMSMCEYSMQTVDVENKNNKPRKYRISSGLWM